MKLSQELYERISNLTMTNYEGIYPKDPDKEYVIVFEDNIEAMLEDLLVEIGHKEEEIEDIKQDIEDNYKPRDLSSQYDINEGWFH